MSQLFIIIPVLNESENIPILAKNCEALITLLPPKLELSTRFIFIDDGSTDDTVKTINESFKHFKVDIISHTKNMGPGKAFAHSFSYIEHLVQNNDWVLTMEGDNTSNHSIIPQMFHRAEEGYNLVLASPYIYGGTIINTVWWKKCLSFISNHFIKELLGLRGICTMSCFFRLHHGSLIQNMQNTYSPELIESHGFEGIIELLMKCVYMNETISEVPLTVDTSKRKGRSKMKIIKTSLSILLLLRYKKRWMQKAKETSPEKILQTQHRLHNIG